MIISRIQRFAEVLTAVCGASGLLLLMGLATPASAQYVFHQATSAAVSDGVINGFLREQGVNFDSSTPEDVALIGFNKTYSNGATFTADSAANYRGFWSTGTFASGQVLNASYPTTEPEIFNTSQPFGYYVLGGMGSFTKHRFVTPESLSGAFGQFNWHVDGDLAATLGTANSRLDFAVTQGATSFNDLYNSAITPNLMTKFGPGTYSYTTGIALDTPLDFLFWSSAYWQVTPAELAALGTQHRDISGHALFMNTFNLDSIYLYNGDGTLVKNWSLLDDATGQVLFNQDGRVVNSAAAPEPSSVALLLGTSLIGGGTLWRRRYRSAQKRVHA